MADLKIGSKVLYRTDPKAEWLKGVVHGVRSYDDQRTKTLVTAYLVDTGADERLDEIVTEPDKDNIFVRQPEQVEVSPDNIKKA